MCFLWGLQIKLNKSHLQHVFAHANDFYFFGQLLTKPMEGNQAAMDEDAVSLPDSVVSEKEGNSDTEHGSDAPSLPPSVGNSLPDSPGQEELCCKRGHCKTKFQKDELEEYKMQFVNLTFSVKQQKIYEKVKEVFQSGGSDPKKPFPWKLLGQSVCRRFWEIVHAVGHGTLDKFVSLAKAGHTHVPESGPKLPRASPASDELDTWFLRLYQQLAEPLAVPGSGDSAVGPPQAPGDDGELTLTDVNHPLFAATVNACRSAVGGRQGQIKVPRKYLQFQSEADLFQFYQTDAEQTKQVSKSTFHRAWGSWKAYLPLKTAGQQSKCSLCASFSEARTQATDSLERAAIDREKKIHLDQVMSDRRVNTRGNKMASDPSVFAKGFNDQSFMKLQIDGIDQAKFVLPRVKKLQGTSALSKCWRPQVHVTGVIVFGLLEYYAVMPPDCPKDSSMNASIIAHVLDLLAEKFRSKGTQFCFPPNLIIGCDNTPRESKNTYFSTFCGWLVCKHVFQTIQVEFLQVDHTHAELDQRFSSMSSIMMNADGLQDPGDVVSLLKSHMKAASGRDLVVEAFPNTWNFKSWFAPLQLHVGGLTATKSEPWACHVWRFSHRLLEADCRAIETHHPDWQSLPEHPSDCILSVKQFMASPEQCQPPQL